MTQILEETEAQKTDNRDLAAKWIKDLRSDPTWIRKPAGERKHSGQREN